MMGRPVHFEIHASYPAVLIDFYSSLFGWTFTKWEGGEYWLIRTGPADRPGIDGGLLPRPGPKAPDMAGMNAFVVTIDVEDIDAMIAKAQSGGAGGVLCVPKMSVPGIGWLAYLKDPDRNIFGIMQFDANAN
jgi:predicted enzyme related to lactoylglutathione lyase